MAAPTTAGAPGAPRRSPMHAFRVRYGLVLEWIVGALMVVLAVEVTVGVVFRTLGAALPWYDELASVLLAWLTFYGSALASVKRAHIGCPEIVDRMRWSLRRFFNMFAQVLVIAFFALLGWVGADILPILHGEAMVSLPWIPMSVVQSVIPVTAAMIVVAEFTHLVDTVAAREPAAAPGGDPALADGLH